MSFFYLTSKAAGFIVSEMEGCGWGHLFFLWLAETNHGALSRNQLKRYYSTVTNSHLRAHR